MNQTCVAVSPMYFTSDFEDPERTEQSVLKLWFSALTAEIILPNASVPASAAELRHFLHVGQNAA